MINSVLFFSPTFLELLGIIGFFKTVCRFKYSSSIMLPISYWEDYILSLSTDLPDSTLIRNGLFVSNVRMQKASRSHFKRSVSVLEPSIGVVQLRLYQNFNIVNDPVH